MTNKNNECVGEYKKRTTMSKMRCDIVHSTVCTLFYLALDLVVL